MALFMIPFAGCNIDSGNDNADSTSSTSDTSASSGVSDVVPEPEVIDYFSQTVEALAPVAAYNCDASGDDGNKMVDAVSGTEAKLVNCSFENGYVGAGVRTDFERMGYIDLGTELAGKLNGKGAITVSLWVLPYLNYNTNIYRLISFPIDGGKAGMNLHYKSQSISLGGRSAANENYISKTFEYSLKNEHIGTLADNTNEGQWQHIVATLNFEKNKIELVVNGTNIYNSQSISFANNSYVLGAPNVPMTIGGVDNESVYSFNGIIDNIFVFDRALTAKEVKELGNATNVPGRSPISDENLIEEIIKKMGNDTAFFEGACNVLSEGMSKPLSTFNTSLRVIRHNGELYIPAESANTFFAESGGVTSVTLEGTDYKSLSALCSANGKTLLSYGKLAIAMSDESQFSVSTDRQMLERIVEFFGSKAATKEFSDTELSRVVVEQSGGANGNIVYCASPSIVKVGNDIYASMDSRGKDVYVYKSTDGGKSFSFRGSVSNFKFSTIFELNGALYLIGVAKTTGKAFAAITKSTDGGLTWSAITDTQGRLPASSDGFDAHGSSTAVLFANGRVYKAFSGQGSSWRTGCTAYIESAPIDSDLLDPASWTVSSYVSFNTSIFNNHPSGSKVPSYVYCQEGNVVLGKDGGIYAVYRVDSAPCPGYSLVMKLSSDNKTLTFDTSDKNSIVRLDGGFTKSTIRYDASSGLYIALVNNVEDNRSFAQRNILSIITSPDLINWTVREELLIDRSFMNEYVSLTRHGFQYVDWTIAGDDIIFAVREAMGDSVNYHNANNLTFYRLKNYKEYLK